MCFLVVGSLEKVEILVLFEWGISISDVTQDAVQTDNHSQAWTHTHSVLHSKIDGKRGSWLVHIID